MNSNNSIAFTYISGLALIISSFAFGQFEIGLLVIGVLFVLLGLFSKTQMGLVKQLDTRLGVFIWVVLSIFTAFASNLFGFTTNKTLVWGAIILSLLNLVLILISKFKLDEIE
jgi:hypothetical protein